MPAISAFYGITVYMYRETGCKHHKPHVHAKYAEHEITMSFDGDVLDGWFPANKQKLLVAWLEIHMEDLLLNWQLLQAGERVFRIEPLK